ncbi:hypothetical protein BJ546DRAFT_1004761, partial [Cryomyces antarcticus]
MKSQGSHAREFCRTGKSSVIDCLQGIVDNTTTSHTSRNPDRAICMQTFMMRLFFPCSALVLAYLKLDPVRSWLGHGESNEAEDREGHNSAISLATHARATTGTSDDLPSRKVTSKLVCRLGHGSAARLSLPSGTDLEHQSLIRRPTTQDESSALRCVKAVDRDPRPHQRSTVRPCIPVFVRGEACPASDKANDLSLASHGPPDHAILRTSKGLSTAALYTRSSQRKLPVIM